MGTRKIINKSLDDCDDRLNRENYTGVGGLLKFRARIAEPSGTDGPLRKFAIFCYCLFMQRLTVWGKMGAGWHYVSGVSL